VTRPRALTRLEQALSRLATLAQPTFGRGDHLGNNPRHNASDPTGNHVTSNRWQQALGRRLRDVDQLAARIEADITGLDLEHAERWRCTCGKYQRAVANYCDTCGTARARQHV